MSAFAESSRAWQPLTPRGVAAFAAAGLGRLLLMQCIVALFAAAVVVWFVYDNCFPAIGKAIQKLPATAEIRSGVLEWQGRPPELLADSRFLAFDVDPDHSGRIGSMADVKIEFGRKTVRIFSLLGYLDWPYPRNYVIAFNRTELEPLWGAWAVEFLMITAVASVIGLLLSWWFLAAFYSLPVWLLGFFTNRDLNFHQSWQLSGAALMPGVLLMIAAILFYGLGFWNLVLFGFAFGTHFLIGWIYLFLSLLFLTPVAAQKRNPFTSRPRRSPLNSFRFGRRDED